MRTGPAFIELTADAFGLFFLMQYICGGVPPPPELAVERGDPSTPFGTTVLLTPRTCTKKQQERVYVLAMDYYGRLASASSLDLRQAGVRAGTSCGPVSTCSLAFGLKRREDAPFFLPSSKFNSTPQLWD